MLVTTAQLHATGRLTAAAGTLELESTNLEPEGTISVRFQGSETNYCITPTGAVWEFVPNQTPRDVTRELEIAS